MAVDSGGIDDSVPALLGEFLTAPPDFTYPDDFGSPLIAALFDENAPDLNFAWPPVSQVQVDTPFNLLNFVEEIVLLGGDLQVPGPTTVIDEWDRGIDAVSAVLTRRSVINEWAARETNGQSVSVFETEWVVTFPTRYPPSNNYYFPYIEDGVPAIAPFTDGGTPIHTALWNREERVTGCVSGIGQDTACQPDNNLPYEVNVINFRGNKLGTNLTDNVADSIIVKDISGTNSVYKENFRVQIANDAEAIERVGSRGFKQHRKNFGVTLSDISFSGIMDFDEPMLLAGGYNCCSIAALDLNSQSNVTDKPIWLVKWP